MRRSVWIALIALCPLAAVAAERPDWAFPVTEKVLPPSKDDGQPKHAPGSDKSYTRAQIDEPLDEIPTDGGLWAFRTVGAFM